MDGGGKDWDELLLYVAMGYRKCVAYSPYFLIFGRDLFFKEEYSHSDMRSWIQPLQLNVFKSAWTNGAKAFKPLMPLAMRNLARAQQRHKERYRLVRGSGWGRPEAYFQAGDYVLLEQQTDSKLDAPARPHVGLTWWWTSGHRG